MYDVHLQVDAAYADTISLSGRFRQLKLWLMMRAYGVEDIKRYTCQVSKLILYFLTLSKYTKILFTAIRCLYFHFKNVALVK